MLETTEVAGSSPVDRRDLRHTAPNYTRRRFVVGGVAAALVGLVAYGTVDALSGTSSQGRYPVGHFESSTFHSTYRRQRVGYGIGYPPRYGPGDSLPLVLALLGYGASHWSIGGFNAWELAHLSTQANPQRPLAVATIDGGGGYWHPHPTDDPMGMVIEEFLPMLESRGLGVGVGRLGVAGISMGGCGAIVVAEHYPDLFDAIAVGSPAIFTTYNWVHYVNPSAYWGPQDFAQYNAFARTDELRGKPLWISSGAHDPFRNWVKELEGTLPAGASIHVVPGGHTGDVFHAEMPLAMAFLGQHLRPTRT